MIGLLTLQASWWACLSKAHLPLDEVPQQAVMMPVKASPMWQESMPAEEVECSDCRLGEGCLGNGADSSLQAIQGNGDGVLHLPAPQRKRTSAQQWHRHVLVGLLERLGLASYEDTSAGC